MTFWVLALSCRATGGGTPVDDTPAPATTDRVASTSAGSSPASASASATNADTPPPRVLFATETSSCDGALIEAAERVCATKGAALRGHERKIAVLVQRAAGAYAFYNVDGTGRGYVVDGDSVSQRLDAGLRSEYIVLSMPGSWFDASCALGRYFRGAAPPHGRLREYDAFAVDSSGAFEFRLVLSHERSERYPGNSYAEFYRVDKSTMTVTLVKAGIEPDKEAPY